MEEEDELDAMRTISQTLESLDADARGRVIRWIVDKHRTSTKTSLEEMESLEDLWVATNPEIQSDRVLVVGTWLQVREDEQHLEALQVNSILKDLGHGISNITSAFTELIEARPQLAIQVRKSGTSRQARKQYRITVAGIKRVDEMISGNGVE